MSGVRLRTKRIAKVERSKRRSPESFHGNKVTFINSVNANKFGIEQLLPACREPKPNATTVTLATDNRETGDQMNQSRREISLKRAIN